MAKLHPLEQALSQYLSEWDQYIAYMESQVPESSGAAEFNKLRLDEVKARRDTIVNMYRRTVRINLLLKWLPLVFFGLFVSFCICVPFSVNQRIVIWPEIAAIASIVLMVVSGSAYILLLFVRKLVWQGRLSLQFRLRTLFVWTTLIAVILGLITFFARR